MPTKNGFTSRIILTTSALIGMATAIGILTVGDPFALFANVRTSLLEISALQPGAGQSAAAIQSTAGSKDLPPAAAREAPTRDQNAADQSQTKISQPSTEDLFKQFQAWAAEKDKRAKVGPMKSVQDALVQDDRPNLRIRRTDRQVWPVQDVRAEIRPRQNPRKKVLRAQNARVQARPVQDARAQVQPVQQSLSAARSESEK